MESRIASAIGAAHGPVAVVLAEEKPEGALEFKPGRWGCVMFLFANAAKGKTAAFSAETYGCWGGGVGLGFGNVYLRFPGGVDCFAHFLSSGNAGWEQGRQVGEALQAQAGKEFARDFLEGEGYLKTPALVHRWLEDLPIQETGSRFVVFKPLAAVDRKRETPATVVFLADPDQLAALVILANYARGGMENVIIPWAAGCQTIGILPFREGQAEKPRAVVGLTDISARKYVRPLLGENLLTFAVPWRLFVEMEENVPGSFLEKPTWQALLRTKR